MIYLNKIVDPVYQYRYGAKQEIKEVLQCVKNFQKAYYPENQEMIFEPISIYYICSELIEMAELPENPYLLQVLQEKYQQAETKSKNGLLFTLEELFGQGWLQKTEEEWLWNNSSYEYKGLTSYCNQKEKQIVMFLQSLIDTKYKDGIYPRINEESIELFELLNKTGLSVEWLIEKKFLVKKKMNYTLTHSVRNGSNMEKEYCQKNTKNGTVQIIWLIPKNGYVFARYLPDAGNRRNISKRKNSCLYIVLKD